MTDVHHQSPGTLLTSNYFSSDHLQILPLLCILEGFVAHLPISMYIFAMSCILYLTAVTFQSTVHLQIPLLQYILAWFVHCILAHFHFLVAVTLDLYQTIAGTYLSLEILMCFLVLGTGFLNPDPMLDIESLLAGP